MIGMQRDLIYDVGLHRGEDTQFYLAKGFRVVAIDANEELCAEASARFAPQVASGRLRILNRAISAQSGEATFFRNAKRSEWGTIDPRWAERNRSKGAGSTCTIVRASSLAEVTREFGVPYYAKIDIEGLDLVALRSLGAATARPKYVSIESEKVSFAALDAEFTALRELGYDRFKVVAQHEVTRQRAPSPPLEGQYCEHVFERGASGLFGEEAPGAWVSAEAAIEAYRPIFTRYRLIGDAADVRTRVLRQLARAVGMGAGWYDTHARLAGE
jgi:FkbM family methyltransferase